jgi:ABC-type amino acid transport substrate-binding protein
VIGAAALIALAAGGARLLRDDRDLAWARIQAQGVFVVATDSSYPPFSAADDQGGLFGFDVDLADAIAARWGVRAEFENITYDALLAALVAGRDDAVISAFVLAPDRLHEVAYTRPYFVGGTVAVIRQADGDRLTGDPLAWAADKRLAVEYGAGGDALARHWARRAPGIEVVPMSAPAEALLAVENGEADAAVVDAISAYDFLRGHPALVIAGAPLEPEPYVIAVARQNRVLLRELEAALAALESDGTLPALREKWLGMREE